MFEAETNYPQDIYDTFVGIKFTNSSRAYFFGVKKGMDVKLNEIVVVETVRGTELGTVAMGPFDIKNYTSNLGLKPVVRIASEGDLRTDELNKKDAVFALEICQAEANALGLKMNLISCEYTLDRSKVIFSYLADERVDFRDLLKVLASKLKTRIELRQIGTRDKAKMIGGIGICGLPLCCATFLNEFDGISISRAKNQMLVINIPKLSGHCGKLICCLQYEDDAYTDRKKYFPEIGTKVFIDKKEYNVSSINILSSIIRIDGPENDIMFLSLDDFKKQTNWRSPKKEIPPVVKQKEVIKEEVIEEEIDYKDNRGERHNNHRRNRNFHKYHGNKNPKAGNNEKK